MRWPTARPTVLPPGPSPRRQLFGERRHTPISRLMCGLLAGAGLLGLAHGAFELLRTAAMHAWPVAHATVLSVSVERNARLGIWEPRVRYIFEVEAKRYTNTRLALTPVTFSSYPEAQDYVHRHWRDRFRPGAVIAVRYNPSNPLDSFVDVQVTRRIGMLASASAFLPLLALAVSILMWRKPVPLWTRPPALFDG